MHISRRYNCCPCTSLSSFDSGSVHHHCRLGRCYLLLFVAFKIAFLHYFPWYFIWFCLLLASISRYFRSHLNLLFFIFSVAFSFGFYFQFIVVFCFANYFHTTFFRCSFDFFSCHVKKISYDIVSTFHCIDQIILFCFNSEFTNIIFRTMILIWMIGHKHFQWAKIL